MKLRLGLYYKATIYKVIHIYFIKSHRHIFLGLLQIGHPNRLQKIPTKLDIQRGEEEEVRGITKKTTTTPLVQCSLQIFL